MRNLYYCVTKSSNEKIFMLYGTRDELIRQKPPIYKRVYDAGTNTSEMVKNAEERFSANLTYVTSGTYPVHNKRNFQYSRKRV